jgi:hypothetical protein
MTNLLAQMAASIEANAMQINVSLHQLASNNTQLQQQQQLLMQQMAMLTRNAATAHNNTYVPTNATIYAPPPYPKFPAETLLSSSGWWMRQWTES